MRYVDGTDLRELILKRGALPPAEVAEIAGQIAGALHAAHALGIVHRDVKPANILIGATAPHAYLTDFGLTKTADTGSMMTRSGMIMGSFDYIAPEQLEGGAVDGRTDVYALGCVIYEALTGDVPYPRDTGAGEAVRARRDAAAVAARGQAGRAARARRADQQGDGEGPGRPLRQPPPSWPRRCRPPSAAPRRARRPTAPRRRPRCPSRCRRRSSRMPARSRSSGARPSSGSCATRSSAPAAASARWCC